MTTPLHSREEIGLRPPERISRSITPRHLTAHYGGPSPWGNADRSSPAAFRDSTNHDRCASIVRAWQAYHMDTHDWVDIAYSSGTCPHGHRYEMRGPGVRTAANGTNDGNQGSYATVYIAGGDDPVTDEAKAAFQDEAARFGVPLDREHGQWKPTACAGSPIRQWQAAGWVLGAAPAVAPAPPPPPPPPVTPGSQRQRAMELQRLLGVRADGVIGPATEAAMRARMIGWPRYVRHRAPRLVDDLHGNRRPELVKWLQRQLNRKAGGFGVDGRVGPNTNHGIVVVLGQSDGVCGPNGFKAAVT